MRCIFQAVRFARRRYHGGQREEGPYSQVQVTPSTRSQYSDPLGRRAGRVLLFTVGVQVPEVSLQTVHTLLGTERAGPAKPRAEVLGTARGAQHKLAATLLSLWAREPEGLSDAEAAELAAGHERIDRYRRLRDDLGKIAPDAFILKGLTIGALYPAGVLRSAGDLDVVCPGAEDFWACSQHLLDGGWELEAFTVWQARRGDGLPHHFLAEFSLSDPGGPVDAEPLVVGLVTAELITDVRRRPIQLTRPARAPLAVSLVALVAERWEREFRSRDLLDLTLILDALDDAGIRAARTDLGRAGLWPQWRQAVAAIRALGWQPPELPVPRFAVAREQAARAARALIRRLHPVRAIAALALSGVEQEAGRLADIAADLTHRLGGRRVLRAGLPLFAVPLEDPVRTGALRLDDVRGHLVARTPVGSFLLVAGAARAEWLEEATTATADEGS